MEDMSLLKEKKSEIEGNSDTSKDEISYRDLISEVDDVEQEIEKTETVTDSSFKQGDEFGDSIREITKELKQINEQLRNKIMEENKKRNQINKSLNQKQKQKLREAENSDRSDAEELLRDYKDGKI